MVDVGGERSQGWTSVSILAWWMKIAMRCDVLRCELTLVTGTQLAAKTSHTSFLEPEAGEGGKKR